MHLRPLLLLLFFMVSPALASPTYTMLSVPGSSRTAAYGINNIGQIVGSYTSSPTSFNQGFIYQDGYYTTVNFPGALSTEILGINDYREVVGGYYFPGGLTQGFLYSGGSFTTINYPGATITELSGINNFGQIVGLAQDTSRDIYFLYSAGVFTDIATYPLGTSVGAGVPVGINSLGQTVGWFSNIVVPPNFPAHPAGINDSGHIVGWYQGPGPGDSTSIRQRGFLEINGVFSAIDFPDAPGFTLAQGINNADQIVGLFYDGTTTRGFVATLATTPFAAFTATVELKFGPRINDTFDLHTSFTPGAGSDGIDPVAEEVTLTLVGGTGSFTTTIPTGSFTKDKQGRFTFRGTIDGVKLDAVLTPLGGQHYAFTVAGQNTDISGIANPVTVTFTIGDDSGSTAVTATLRS
jgi:uncharacterized membrane protein